MSMNLTMLKTLESFSFTNVIYLSLQLPPTCHNLTIHMLTSPRRPFTTYVCYDLPQLKNLSVFCGAPQSAHKVFIVSDHIENIHTNSLLWIADPWPTKVKRIFFHVDLQGKTVVLVLKGKLLRKLDCIRQNPLCVADRSVFNYEAIRECLLLKGETDMSLSEWKKEQKDKNKAN